jgi:hypothetical protein
MNINEMMLQSDIQLGNIDKLLWLRAHGVEISHDDLMEARKNLMKREPVWVDKRWRVHKIESISDSYLINIIKLYIKALKMSRKTSALAYPQPQGEMAQDAYWQAAEQEEIYPHIEQVWDSIQRSNTWAVLMSEAFNRKLNAVGRGEIRIYELVIDWVMEVFGE